ncbi:uncharacterized protein LOC124147714 [Haliotis rufescens]|uniref:uncharacterized protein LOC124147714 n=1 Tax=Haliotis rufescens TaxID=6454 RepID=UPI001EAFF357|nr:uncharacterized protein LOC124147714 [Haliotis rufescens]
MEELRVEDPQSFVNYPRVEPAMFDELIQRVGPRVEKRDTKMRKALPPGLKLAITVRFLDSGNTIGLIIPAKPLWRNTRMITCPTTPEEWTPTGVVFRNRWKVPYAVASMWPSGNLKSGSSYHNYKGFFSVVLVPPCGWRLQVPVGGHQSIWKYV